MVKQFPTARELMDSRDWLYRNRFEEGLFGINYYVEKRPNGKLCVHYIECASDVGSLVFPVVKALCKFGRLLINTVSKEAGDRVFNEIIEEIDELLLARNHNLSIRSSAFSTGRTFDTLGECDVEIHKHLEKWEAK